VVHLHHFPVHLHQDTPRPRPAAPRQDAPSTPHSHAAAGFYGAAKAAEASGDKQKTTTYFTELLRLTKNADTDRPEIRAAKQALAAR